MILHWVAIDYKWALQHYERTDMRCVGLNWHQLNVERERIRLKQKISVNGITGQIVPDFRSGNRKGSVAETVLSVERRMLCSWLIEVDADRRQQVAGHHRPGTGGLTR